MTDPFTRKLDEVRAAWACAQAQNTACTHERGTTFVAQIAANRAVHVYRGCADCKTRLEPGWVSHRELRGLDIDSLPVGRDDTMFNPPCQVCGDFGAEVHHWAPREVFGPVEPDHWPTSYLCRACHEEWHKRIADFYADPARPF